MTLFAQCLFLKCINKSMNILTENCCKINASKNLHKTITTILELLFYGHPRRMMSFSQQHTVNLNEVKKNLMRFGRATPK